MNSNRGKISKTLGMLFVERFEHWPILKFLLGDKRDFY